MLQKDADVAFLDVTRKGPAFETGVLRAVVEEGEGEDNLLLITVRLEVKGCAEPVETSLQAAFGKERPVPGVVQRGLKDAAYAAAEMVALIGAPPARLIEALSSSEPDIQLFAAKMVGLRKIKGAAEPLCQMLKDPREEAAEAAADALKKTATQKDVPRVIQSIVKRNLRSEVRAMEIIAALGGNEAEAYLEMTSLGHEIPEVQSISQSLLRIMRSGRGEANAGH